MAEVDSMHIEFGLASAEFASVVAEVDSAITEPESVRTEFDSAYPEFASAINEVDAIPTEVDSASAEADSGREEPDFATWQGTHHGDLRRLRRNQRSRGQGARSTRGAAACLAEALAKAGPRPRSAVSRSVRLVD